MLGTPVKKIAATRLHPVFLGPLQSLWIRYCLALDPRLVFTISFLRDKSKSLGFAVFLHARDRLDTVRDPYRVWRFHG